MTYDEDRKELEDQFHGLGDYRAGNPDLAVGSTARLPESAPEPLPAPTYQVVASTCEGDPGYEYLVIRNPGSRCIGYVMARFGSLADADLFVQAREAADRVPPPF